MVVEKGEVGRWHARTQASHRRFVPASVQRPLLVCASLPTIPTNQQPTSQPKRSQPPQASPAIMKKRPLPKNPKPKPKPGAASASSIADTIARVSGLATRALEPSDEDVARLLALEVGNEMMDVRSLSSYVGPFIARLPGPNPAGGPPPARRGEGRRWLPQCHGPCRSSSSSSQEAQRQQALPGQHHPEVRPSVPVEYSQVTRCNTLTDYTHTASPPTTGARRRRSAGARTGRRSAWRGKVAVAVGRRHPHGAVAAAEVGVGAGRGIRSGGAGAGAGAWRGMMGVTCPSRRRRPRGSWDGMGVGRLRRWRTDGSAAWPCRRRGVVAAGQALWLGSMEAARPCRRPRPLAPPRPRAGSRGPRRRRRERRRRRRSGAKSKTMM